MPKPKLLAVVTEQAAQRAHAALATHATHQPPSVTLKTVHVSAVDLPVLLDTEQAALILGLAPSTLANDRVTAEIGLPFVKVGGRVVRYRASDIAAFIEARVVRPAKVAA